MKNVLQKAGLDSALVVIGWMSFIPALLLEPSSVATFILHVIARVLPRGLL